MKTIVAAEYHVTNVTLLFNPEPFHAAPATLLYGDTALLHHLVDSSYSFAVANHPLPQSIESKIEEEATTAFDSDSFSYASNIMFGFSFVAASFVVFLITERSR